MYVHCNPAFLSSVLFSIKYVEMHFGDIAPLFMESYDWFTKEAAKRVAKPDDVHAPIWCSISADNCLKPIPGTIVYVLEAPEENVMYFDDVKWRTPPLTSSTWKTSAWRMDLNSSRAVTKGNIRRRSERSARAGCGALRSITGRSSMYAAISGRSGKNG